MTNIRQAETQKRLYIVVSAMKEIKERLTGNKGEDNSLDGLIEEGPSEEGHLSWAETWGKKAEHLCEDLSEGYFSPRE